MYVCMYACMHVCMYACMHVWLCNRHTIQMEKILPNHLFQRSNAAAVKEEQLNRSTVQAVVQLF